MSGKAGGGRTAQTRHTFGGGYEMACVSLNRNCKLKKCQLQIQSSVKKRQERPQIVAAGPSNCRLSL